jgi:hypothetical protein
LFARLLFAFVFGWICLGPALADSQAKAEKAGALPDPKELHALLQSKPEIAVARKKLAGYELPANPKEPGKVVFYWKIVRGRAFEDTRVICTMENGVVVAFRMVDSDSATR